MTIYLVSPDPCSAKTYANPGNKTDSATYGDDEPWQSNGWGNYSTSVAVFVFASPLATGWVRFLMDITGASAYYNPVPFILRDEANGRNLFRVYATVAHGKESRLEYWNGSAWVALNTQLFTFANSNDGLYWIDVNFNMHETDGFVRVYANGSLALSYEGDTIRTASTTVDSINVISGTGATFETTYNGGVIVSDDCTIGQRILDLRVTGDGEVVQWSTTGGWAFVDEYNNVDTDLISSATAGQVEVFALRDPPAKLDEMAYTIKAVSVGLRASHDSVAPLQVRPVLRLGGVNYPGTTRNPGTAYVGAHDIWHLNPATGAAWTSAELTALQAGVESIT